MLNKYLNEWINVLFLLLPESSLLTDFSPSLCTRNTPQLELCLFPTLCGSLAKWQTKGYRLRAFGPLSYHRVFNWVGKKRRKMHKSSQKSSPCISIFSCCWPDAAACLAWLNLWVLWLWSNLTLTKASLMGSALQNSDPFYFAPCSNMCALITWLLTSSLCRHLQLPSAVSPSPAFDPSSHYLLPPMAKHDGMTRSAVVAFENI